MPEMEFSKDSTVTLVDYMGGDNRAALSAWVSFNSDQDERLQDSGRVEKLLAFLLKNEHHTPFESTVMTFCIETPIFVAREFMRHRSASYNEMSGRYVELPGKFYLPDTDRPMVQKGKPGEYYFVKDEAKALESMSSIGYANGVAWRVYQEMLNSGIAKEVARMVLPVNLYTRFYVTMNARNLMHFLDLRQHETALYEIREVADKMAEAFIEVMPITSKIWESLK